MSQSVCIHCGKPTVSTVDSRHFPGTPWRVRRKLCTTCLQRWTTYEVPADVLSGLRDFRYHISGMRERIIQLDTLLNNVPVIGKEGVDAAV